jgi:hypothetical protein
MNCKIFRLQLDNSGWQRGELSLPPDAQAHLDFCAACREHFQLQQQMLAALEHDAAPQLPADFTAKILDRLELIVAPKIFFNWKRVALYAGCAASLALALWFGFKNFNLTALEQMLHSPLARQIQQWLAAIGALEILQALQRFVTSVLSFIPNSGDLLEKAFGKEILPRAFNLTMILMLTFVIVKASVLLENWVRQISRRSS